VSEGLSDGDETRPWGRFEILAAGAGYKVKRITVSPGRRLSYQRHGRRSEHWFLVGGTGLVTLDGESHLVVAGSAVDVPVGTAHRIQCTSDEPVVFIEVQTGTYFGEDDIERLADDYGRARPD
jgi:mannose-6-phosphate isomerase